MLETQGQQEKIEDRIRRKVAECFITVEHSSLLKVLERKETEKRCMKEIYVVVGA